MPRRPASSEEARFRRIFHRLHAEHPGCLRDEWLGTPCRDSSGQDVVPIVWSRRNGPWRRVPVLFVGAAPGNAGGRGTGELGAHGTRIPFGGDVAGANLEVLLGSAGLTRNDVFISAAYNRLPSRGGGEPTASEIREPVGDYRDSLESLHDTILAAGAKLVVALGSVAVRCIAASVAEPADRLPGPARLERRGLRRGTIIPLARAADADASFADAWRDAWGSDSLPDLLWLVHPSAQNMSPFARRNTAFHRRLLDARDALRTAVAATLGTTPPEHRAPVPSAGIYALPEWRERIAPRLERMDRLWREHGI